MRLNPRGFKRLYIVLCAASLLYGLWLPLKWLDNGRQERQKIILDRMRSCRDDNPTDEAVSQCRAGWQQNLDEMWRQHQQQVDEYLSWKVWPLGKHILDWAVLLLISMVVVYWIIVGAAKVVRWVLSGFRTAPS